MRKAAKAVTIKEIAVACGVSPSTVSLVLNGSPKIKEATRLRVLRAVEELDYQPNEMARGLVSSRSRCLSVTVPALNHVFSDVYFGEIISGIYQEANDSGYKILLDLAQERFIAEKEYINLLRNRRADGMLVVASTVADDHLFEFEQQPYPVMLVNHYFPGSRLPFLSVDYRMAAELAAEHLLDLGHRHIGLVIGTNTHTGIDFQTRFLEVCAARGVPESQVPCIGVKDWDEQEGYEAARTLMSRHPQLTAIMAGNDRMAIGAMRWLLQVGFRVPAEISVMGMDNIPSSKFTSPGLTTLRMDFFRVGQASCRRLLSMLSAKSGDTCEFLEPQLVVRESTAPARG